MSMNSRTRNSFATLISGMLFGFGLAFATMIRPESVLSFLQFDDFGLLLVLGAAVTLNLVVFWIAPRFLFQASISAKPIDFTAIPRKNGVKPMSATRRRS